MKLAVAYRELFVQNDQFRVLPIEYVNLHELISQISHIFEEKNNCL